MQHYAALNLGLHCLQKYLFRVSRIQRVNEKKNECFRILTGTETTTVFTDLHFFSKKLITDSTTVAIIIIIEINNTYGEDELEEFKW